MKRNILQLERGSIIQRTEKIDENKQRKEQQDFLRISTESMGIGISIALPITLGAIFGSYLDSKFHTEPKLLLSFLLLGILISFLTLYRTIQNISK